MAIEIDGIGHSPAPNRATIDHETTKCERRKRNEEFLFLIVKIDSENAIEHVGDAAIGLNVLTDSPYGALNAQRVREAHSIETVSSI